MDARGGGPPHRGPGRDGAGGPADPGRRAPVERTDQVVSRIRGSGYPTKLTEPRLGCSPPGRRQERREQDAHALECLDDAGGLELLRLPLLPDRAPPYSSRPARSAAIMTALPCRPPRASFRCLPYAQAAP